MPDKDYVKRSHLDHNEPDNVHFEGTPTLEQILDLKGLPLAVKKQRNEDAHGELPQEYQHVVDANSDYTSALEDALKKATLEGFTDPLTELWNRRGFDKYLNVIREKNLKNLGVIYIDIDNFKQWNDQHNHDVGDHVLSTVAKYLTSQLRENDVYRLGGEEIAIIVEADNIEKLASVAQRLKDYMSECLADQYFIKVDGKNQKLTASFGVALFNDSEDPKETALRADNALLHAKGSGKNKVAYLPHGQDSFAIYNGSNQSK